MLFPVKSNPEISFSTNSKCDTTNVETVFQDTLQNLINDYCRQLDLEQSNKKKSDNDSIQIGRFKSQISELKKTHISLILKILQNDLKKITLDSVALMKMHADTLYHQMLRIQDSIKFITKERNEYLDLHKRIITTRDTLLKTIKDQTTKLNGSRSILFKKTEINIFIANLDSNDINMHLKNEAGKNYFNAGSLLSFLKKEKLDPLMITNAGMFTQTYNPKGLYIENFRLIVKIDTGTAKHDVNFYMYPNGIFCIDSNDVPYIFTTQEYKALTMEKKGQIRNATQSGPMLVINDSIHQKFTKGSANKNIRNGVGIINAKKVIFAISVQPINFYDFATFFKDIFNCKDALYLDGAISTMYISDLDTNSVNGQLGPLISVTKKK